LVVSVRNGEALAVSRSMVVDGIRDVVAAALEDVSGVVSKGKGSVAVSEE
jgi:hypothetical protein